MNVSKPAELEVLPPAVVVAVGVAVEEEAEVQMVARCSQTPRPRVRAVGSAGREPPPLRRVVGVRAPAHPRSSRFGERARALHALLEERVAHGVIRCVG